MGQAAIAAPFTRRAATWLIGVGAGSLGLTLAFLVAGSPQSAEVRSAGADSFSRSALGHRAFVELMRRSGVPVLVSRYDSAGRANPSALLVLAEPRPGDIDSARLRRMSEMLRQSSTALLVLPKWNGIEDPARPGWIREATPVPVPAVGRVLSTGRVAARLIRHPGSAPEQRCEGLVSPFTLREPQLLEPTTDSLHPIVTCSGGVLVGVVESEDQRLYVLSDPDLISNHGLGAGNEPAARELVSIVRTEGQALVFDEVLHGHERIPALWRELFAFPLLPAVLHGGIALATLVLAGVGRFGAPVPAPLGLAAGKSLLIENTASLLQSAGYSGQTLARYFEAALAEAAAVLHVPTAGKPEQRREWLRAALAQRRTSVSLEALEAQVAQAASAPVSASAAVALARRVHRFKEELRRGPQGHPEH